MRRGTTPTITCKITGADLSGSNIYITIQQGGTEITILNPTVETTEDGCIMVITLTQEQTLRLKKGVADIQIRWVDPNGTALATNVAQITVEKILRDGVIEYE